jgi:hypothetical protein
MAATKRCKQAIATIRERKRQAVWFESLSGFGLRPTAVVRLHKAVAESFDRWWDTWVEPELREAEKG